MKRIMMRGMVVMMTFDTLGCRCDNVKNHAVHHKAGGEITGTACDFQCPIYTYSGSVHHERK